MPKNIVLESDLIELIKAKGKLSVDEAAKIFDVEPATIRKMADYLISSRILGMEYRFTIPYLYLSESSGERKTESEKSREISREIISRLDFDVKNNNLVAASEDFNIALGELIAGKGNKEAVLKLSEINNRIQSGMKTEDYGRLFEEIKELMDECRAHIGYGNMQEAKELYDRISATLVRIPDDYFEQKNPLRNELIDVHQELISIISRQTNTKVDTLKQNINAMIDKINYNISIKNFEEAKRALNECVRLCSKIPKSYYIAKLSILAELLEVYKRLDKIL